MPAVEETVRVQGLAELQRAFALADKQTAVELRKTLRQVAEPVRADAERLAISTIPRLGVPWSRMRVGVTRASVYVAPRERGTRLPQRKRRNLAGLLLGRAMLPALADNQPRIVASVDQMLVEVGRQWEHV